MKRISLTILSCLISTTAYAESIDKTIDAHPNGRVEVSNIAGSIEIDGWSRDSVQVTGTLGKNVEELIFERDGKNVIIKVKVPKGRNRSISSDLRISVPERSSIDVGAVSSNIEVSNVHGEQNLQTVSGNVEAEFNGGRMLAESVSGDVDIEGNNEEGDVAARTVSGNVAVFRVSGELAAEAVSGDVVVDEGSFDRLKVEAVSGNIVFEAGLREDGKLRFETVNGDVDIDLVGPVSAEIEIDTFNGNIRNCFGPKPVRPSKYVPGLELSFVEGDGDGSVKASAVNGNISLCKD